MLAETSPRLCGDRVLRVAVCGPPEDPVTGDMARQSVKIKPIVAWRWRRSCRVNAWHLGHAVIHR